MERDLNRVQQLADNKSAYADQLRVDMNNLRAKFASMEVDLEAAKSERNRVGMVERSKYLPVIADLRVTVAELNLQIQTIQHAAVMRGNEDDMTFKTVVEAKDTKIAELEKQKHASDQAARDNADWFDALVTDLSQRLGCEAKPTAILEAVEVLEKDRSTMVAALTDVKNWDDRLEGLWDDQGDRAAAALRAISTKGQS